MPAWSMNELSKIMRALEDPLFFASDPFFLGLTLFPKQAYVLQEFYKGHYTDLILVCGFKSGKSFIAAVFALYEAFKLLVLDDPAVQYGFEPGTKIYIFCLATSEDQARDTIFSEIVTKIRNSPFFKLCGPKAYALEIRFPEKGIVIFCGTSSSASMVGRPVKVIIYDELSRFEESTSKRGAWVVYNSLNHQTILFGKQAVRIAISSPIHADDIIMQLLDRSKRFPDMLGLLFPTWEFNPKLPFDNPEMIELRNRDPTEFWTNFGCKPSATTEFYFGNREIIQLSELPNLLELWDKERIIKKEAVNYILSGDPALKHDAFGIALGHLELDNYFIDGFLRLKNDDGTELDPIGVKDKILGIIEVFRPFAVVFDTWAFPELQEEIKRKGVLVLNHIVDKETYDRVKELLYRKKLVICNFPFVKEELENLRMIRGLKVDHPTGGSKDISDAMANCLWLIDNYIATPQFPISIGRVV